MQESIKEVNYKINEEDVIVLFYDDEIARETLLNNFEIVKYEFPNVKVIALPNTIDLTGMSKQQLISIRDTIDKVLQDGE